ncbi:MAG: helix-turn-helix domain-containing protein [Planctomycetia bacterium]|nr:helix-turn-helix domain-containing protein [Planctomycetia bacterium]
MTLTAKPAEHGTPDKLLLTPREAAGTLSVSEKSLWSLTTPRGPIKCVRLGRSVRYSIETLREFIAQQSQA